MARKWILLNALLLVAAFWLAGELYRKYEQFKTNSDSVKIDPVPVENPTAEKDASEVSADGFIESPVHRDNDYFLISKNTLFSEMRGRAETDADAAAQAVPPLNPKPILVGTVMIDEQYVASVIDPATARSGQAAVPETRHIGDAYRGYQIISIEANQMVLENNGRKEIIPLNRTARKPQTNAKPAGAAGATRVVSIGRGGKSSGSTIVTTATSAVRNTGQTAARNPGQTAAQNAEQTAAARNAGQTAAQNAGQAAATQAAARAGAQNVASQAGMAAAAQAARAKQWQPGAAAPSNLETMPPENVESPVP